jgi:plasmid stability protein
MSLDEALMATLDVKNIPRDLYAALRRRAKSNQRSIAAEVRALLEENVPTAREMKARHEWVRKLARLCANKTDTSGSFLSTEEIVREDRAR